MTPISVRHENGDQAGDHERDATGAEPHDEVRPGVESDDGDEASQTDRLEHPQRRARNPSEESRISRPQPPADEATEQDADSAG